MSRFQRRVQIGRGGSAIVYKAFDTLTGETVAIKELIRDSELPKAEISIGRSIAHDNVVRIHELIEDDDGSLYLTMEYVNGGNLRDVIEQSGALALEKCLPYWMQILDALQAAHSRNIVHRDLKPENILLTAKGEVKVSDFGHARVAGAKPSLQSQQRIGTLPYAAPEQAKGGQCDARTDIYSLGILFCEMVSGSRPESLESLNLPADLPDQIATILKRCIDMEPSRRVASIADLREALMLAGVSGAGLPEAHTPETARAVSTERMVRIGGRVAAAVVIAALAVGGNSLRREMLKPLPVTLVPTDVEMQSPAPADRAAPGPKKPIQRVAVTGFENRTGDKSIDIYATSIPQVLSTELAHIRTLSVLEPGNAPPFRRSSANLSGEFDDVDAVISGSIEKAGTRIRITGRVYDRRMDDSDTATSVEGAVADLFKLQGTLARQIATLLQGTLHEAASKELAEARATGDSSETFRLFSQGLYYLRQDLATDALNRFNAALSLDPTYPGANYYRGVALTRLNRPDDAIVAFKAALPDSAIDRPVLWSWTLEETTPGTTTVSQHGLIRAFDTAKIHEQHNFFWGEKPTTLQRQVIYTQRTEAGTVLFLFDPERHTVHRQEVVDENIRLNGTAYGTDSATVVTSFTPPLGDDPSKLNLYAFSTDGNRLWEKHLTEFGRDLPRVGFIRDAFYIYYPGLRRLELLDGRTGNLRWRREDLQINGAELPWLGSTRKHGGILIFRSDDSVRALRMKDGKDAWMVPGIQSQKPSLLGDQKRLVIFEPERRVLTVDLETGKPTREILLEQFVDGLLTQYGYVWLVGAVLNGNTLYVLSKDMQFCAIDLMASGTSSASEPPRRASRASPPDSGGELRSGRRGSGPAPFLWKTPLPARPQSIRVYGKYIYVGTEKGDLIVLNTAGKILNTTKITNSNVAIEYAGDDVLVLNSDLKIHGLTPQGNKLWEYPIQFGFDVTYFKGIVTAYATALQLFAVEAKTGKLRWQSAGPSTPWAYMHGDRLFVLGADGVQEYSTGSRSDGVNDRQVLTALAQVNLAKGDLDQASVFVGKARDIDPSYPGAALVRSRLLKAQNKPEEAGIELARYASLVGLNSKESRQAIAEMNRDYLLLWLVDIDSDVAGEPVLIEDKLVSIGRRTGLESHIIALNPKTGAILWRYAASRYVASTSGMYEDRPYLWYVAGDNSKYESVGLYRTDLRTGERKGIANWQRPNRIDDAWIAYSSGRIFVATAFSDLTTSTLEVGIDCFDADSGKHLWDKSYKSNVAAQDLAQPIHLFSASPDSLTYSIASQRWTVRALDGSPDFAAAASEIQHVYELREDKIAAEVDRKTGKIVAKHAILWRPSAFRLEGPRLYAFTTDGHAYAMGR